MFLVEPSIISSRVAPSRKRQKNILPTDKDFEEIGARQLIPKFVNIYF